MRKKYFYNLDEIRPRFEQLYLIEKWPLSEVGKRMSLGYLVYKVVKELNIPVRTQDFTNAEFAAKRRAGLVKSKKILRQYKCAFCGRLFNYNFRGKTYCPECIDKPPKLCACGCGKTVLHIKASYYPGHGSIGKPSPLKGKTLEDILGERASAYRAIHSVKTTERILNGYIMPTWAKVNKGWFYSNKCAKSIFYYSSAELQCYTELESLGTIKNFDRCQFSIKYTDKSGIVRRYIPDLIVTTLSGRTFIIEVKPCNRMLKVFNEGGKYSALTNHCKAKNFGYLIYRTGFTAQDLEKLNNSGC